MHLMMAVSVAGGEGDCRRGYTWTLIHNRISAQNILLDTEQRGNINK